MFDQDSANRFFSDDPLSLEQYWVRRDFALPDVYVLDDPAGDWTAAATADGEVTLWNYYDCLDEQGEPDTCEQELLIENFPAFFYRLIALRDRCEGFFDNDTWQK